MPLLPPLHAYTSDPLSSQDTPDGTLRGDPPACMQYLFGRGTKRQSKTERKTQRDNAL